jgi:hypothetical protein
MRQKGARLIIADPDAKRSKQMQIVSLLTSYNYGYGGPRESRAWTEKSIK